MSNKSLFQCEPGYCVAVPMNTQCPAPSLDNGHGQVYCQLSAPDFSEEYWGDKLKLKIEKIAGKYLTFLYLFVLCNQYFRRLKVTNNPPHGSVSHCSRSQLFDPLVREGSKKPASTSCIKHIKAKIKNKFHSLVTREGFRGVGNWHFFKSSLISRDQLYWRNFN